jgi:Putative transposase
VQRLLVRHGLEPADDATGPADRLADESPVLAEIVGASVQGRVALGSRAGARVRRLGDARDTATAVTLRGPRQAHLDGFDLHANVWVSAHDRAGLERLARYILRPPFAQERLRLRNDGRVALELKTAWHDGTRELIFEPLEFLERLAAMTPRPETNLLICHGVLAPRALWRERVVAYGRVAAEPAASTAPLAPGPDGTGVKPTPRAWTWAALMHRAFAIDVLACVHCGGRLRLIATLHDPAVIRRILAHLDLAHSGQSPGPAPPEFSAAAP